MLRRVSFLCLLLAGLLASSLSAAPSTEPGVAPGAWQGAIQQFGLEIVDQAPPGITPLVVESPRQLRELFAGIGPRHRAVNVKASNLPDLDSLAGDVGIESVMFIPLHEYDSSQWPIVFHLYADLFLLQGTLFFWEIVSCDDWAQFTGSALYSETGGEWSDHSIASNGLSAVIEGGGWIKHHIYLWPIGKIHVMTYCFDMTINFSL
ncbi:hypothetical protein JW848_02745 [Candidatus Bipolaricaulota bacterium]|nr:hypothetical protein [Candidatus Bipolaricaulota bacterium]